MFLPGESQGRGSLVGCCLWGRTELDTTEATQQQQLSQCPVFLLSRESAPTQPRDHSLSAYLSESVIRLISTCQQVEECLLSRANFISQPVDLHLLSPAISAYSAAQSVPVSRLISA